ncbi:alcohol dehydrogenase catalytic domain-containing protein [Streptomyces bobili]
MKGHVFHGPGQAAWEDVPDPGTKEATDAIVRVDAITTSGTDLHILKGDVPEVRPGTVLGYEVVGEFVDIGGDVRTVRPGERVLVSCITACGRCRRMVTGRPSIAARMPTKSCHWRGSSASRARFAGCVVAGQDHLLDHFAALAEEHVLGTRRPTGAGRSPWTFPPVRCRSPGRPGTPRWRR